MSSTLHILSAGAAKGLVETLRDKWTATEGIGIDAQFGAVGAMKEALLAGAPCDVLILTRSILDTLAAQDIIAGDSIRLLGRVYTGIAIPVAAAPSEIEGSQALRQTLLGASAIYLPDLQRATAGIHFLSVLKRLAIDQECAPHLRTFPNGATAMRALADAHDSAAIGCTQVTEILYTDGVVLAGLLPTEFELATMYAVAVRVGSREAESAQRFADFLAGEATAMVRERGGFVASAAAG